MKSYLFFIFTILVFIFTLKIESKKNQSRSNFKMFKSKMKKRYYENINEYKSDHPVDPVKALDKKIKNTEIDNFFFPNHDYMQDMINKTKDYLLTHHKSRCKFY